MSVGMESNRWQAVEDPSRGIYGIWEREHPGCIALGLDTSDRTRLIQTLFATLCFCQVLFMGTRAPRVTWEAVYLPLVETILYSLSASGNGSLRMGDGNIFPFSRMASWLITCPIMLFMICGIHKKMKLRGVEVRNMVMVAALVRVVCGMTASVTTRPLLKWMFFLFGVLCLFFEYFVVGKVFAAGLAKFEAIDTPRNRIAGQRIRVLRGIFYFSWTAFPVIWILSPTGLCLISEDIAAIAYLAADAICKNGNGLIQTNTLFGVLNGKWIPETLAEAAMPHEDRSAETYFNRAIGAIRHSHGRQHAHHPDDVDEHASAAPHKAEGALHPRVEMSERHNSDSSHAQDDEGRAVRFPMAGRDGAASPSEMEEGRGGRSVSVVRLAGEETGRGWEGRRRGSEERPRGVSRDAAAERDRDDRRRGREGSARWRNEEEWEEESGSDGEFLQSSVRAGMSRRRGPREEEEEERRRGRDRSLGPERERSDSEEREGGERRGVSQGRWPRGESSERRRDRSRSFGSER